jgi:hypothetical protein
MVIVDGDWTLTSENGERVHLPQGTTALLPFAAGERVLEGEGLALVARPPAS